MKFQGINAEKKEARAEKEEAEKYQQLQQELVCCWFNIFLIFENIVCCSLKKSFLNIVT